MIWPIIFALITVIFLMIVHEFGHFIIAKRAGIKIEEFGIGYPPRIFGKKIGQTVYSINLLFLGAFVRIKGEEGGLEDRESFSGLPIYKRVAIVLGGVISFWLVAIILFSFVFAIGVRVPIEDSAKLDVNEVQVQISAVRVNSPASIAELQKGDVIKEITALDGNVLISTIKEFQDFVSTHKGQEITLKIQRGESVLEKSLSPRVIAPENEGAVGIELQRTATLIQKYPWYQAPVKGLLFCGELTYRATISLVQFFSDLILGKGLMEGAEPAGPIGLTIFLARAAQMGIGFFLYFIAAVSVLLAIFNLLPIPALDGGKILFLIIEKIRSKAVSPKIEQTITMVFFFTLIALSLFVTIKFDIPRFSEFFKNSF